jgi:hypothetical protein
MFPPWPSAAVMSEVLMLKVVVSQAAFVTPLTQTVPTSSILHDNCDCTMVLQAAAVATEFRHSMAPMAIPHSHARR